MTTTSSPLSSVKCATCAEAERGADIVCPLSLENPAANAPPCGAIVTIPRHIGRRACGALGGGGLRTRPGLLYDNSLTIASRRAVIARSGATKRSRGRRAAAVALDRHAALAMTERVKLAGVALMVAAVASLSNRLRCHSRVPQARPGIQGHSRRPRSADSRSVAFAPVGNDKPKRTSRNRIMRNSTNGVDPCRGRFCRASPPYRPARSP